MCLYAARLEKDKKENLIQWAVEEMGAKVSWSLCVLFSAAGINKINLKDK